MEGRINTYYNYIVFKKENVIVSELAMQSTKTHFARTSLLHYVHYCIHSCLDKLKSERSVFGIGSKETSELITSAMEREAGYG